MRAGEVSESTRLWLVRHAPVSGASVSSTIGMRQPILVTLRRSTCCAKSCQKVLRNLPAQVLRTVQTAQALGTEPCN